MASLKTKALQRYKDDKEKHAKQKIGAMAALKSAKKAAPKPKPAPAKKTSWWERLKSNVKAELTGKKKKAPKTIYSETHKQLANKNLTAKERKKLGMK